MTPDLKSKISQKKVTDLEKINNLFKLSVTLDWDFLSEIEKSRYWLIMVLCWGFM